MSLSTDTGQDIRERPVCSCASPKQLLSLSVTCVMREQIAALRMELPDQVIKLTRKRASTLFNAGGATVGNAHART